VESKACLNVAAISASMQRNTKVLAVCLEKSAYCVWSRDWFSPSII